MLWSLQGAPLALVRERFLGGVCGIELVPLRRWWCARLRATTPSLRAGENERELMDEEKKWAALCETRTMAEGFALLRCALTYRFRKFAIISIYFWSKMGLFGPFALFVTSALPPDGARSRAVSVHKMALMVRKASTGCRRQMAAPARGGSAVLMLAYPAPSSTSAPPLPLELSSARPVTISA